MIKLMKDGVMGLDIEKVKGGGWQVKGDPGLKKQEPSNFGRLMENPAVVEAEWSVDENEVKSFDIGETHALSVTQIRQREWKNLHRV